MRDDVDLARGRGLRHRGGPLPGAHRRAAPRCRERRARAAGRRRGAALRRHRRALLPGHEPDLVDAGGDVAGGVHDRGGVSAHLAALPADGRGRVRGAGGRGADPARAARAVAAASRAGDGRASVRPTSCSRRWAWRCSRSPRCWRSSTSSRTATSSASSSSASIARGTPLETLDRLAHRCVSIGFPVFTLAIVTGAIWVARLGLLHGPGGAAPRIPVRGRHLDRVRGAAHRPGRGRLARAARGVADAGRLRRHGAGGRRRTSSATRCRQMAGREHRSAARRCVARTAPVAVRERLAVEPDAVAPALAELTGAARRCARRRCSSTCNRVELYVAVRRRRPRGDRAGGGAGAARRRRGGRSGRAPLPAPRRRGRPPPVPGRVQPGFAGGRRAADPRPDQAGVRDRRPARHGGRRAARLLRGRRVPRRAARAARDGDRAATRCRSARWPSTSRARSSATSRGGAC